MPYIENPYMYTNPVVRESFVGREKMYKEILEGYIDDKFLSYLLLGDRRLGKTSFLKNFNNKTSKVKLVYGNLQLLGSCSEGMRDIYELITYEIAQALGVSEPDEEELNEGSFESYLKEAIGKSGGLILALDEYEILQRLISQKKIPRKFPETLIKWANFPRLGLILAGYNPLEKLGEELSCLKSILKVKKLNLLDDAEIEKILIEPVREAINYTPEALSLMLKLIHGHPYLANCLGVEIINLVKPRDKALITEEDVRAAWTKVQEQAKGKMLDFAFLLEREVEGEGVRL
jgi:hypothetical protein